MLRHHTSSTLLKPCRLSLVALASGGRVSKGALGRVPRRNSLLDLV